MNYSSMKRLFVKGIGEVATVDVNPHYSFVSVGEQDVQNGVGYAVKTSQVKTAFDCLNFLCKKYGKGWVVKKEL